MGFDYTSCWFVVCSEFLPNHRNQITTTSCFSLDGILYPYMLPFGILWSLLDRWLDPILVIRTLGLGHVLDLVTPYYKSQWFMYSVQKNKLCLFLLPNRLILIWNARASISNDLWLQILLTVEMVVTFGILLWFNLYAEWNVKSNVDLGSYHFASNLTNHAKSTFGLLEFKKYICVLYFNYLKFDIEIENRDFLCSRGEGLLVLNL